VCMIDLGIAFAVNEPADCIRWIETLETDMTKYKAIKNKSDNFFNSNSGATEKIASDLYPYLM